MKKFTKVGENYWCLEDIFYVGAIDYEDGGSFFKVSAGHSTVKVLGRSIETSRKQRDELLKALGVIEQ